MGRVGDKDDTGRLNVRPEFGTQFSDDEYDTIGGLLLQRFGRVPKRGDRESIDGFNFEILRADSRRVHAILVTRAPEAQ